MEVMEQRAAEKEKTAAEKETNIVEGDFQSIIEAFTATLFAAPRQRGNIVGTVKDLQTGKFKDAAGTFATGRIGRIGRRWCTVWLAYSSKELQYARCSWSMLAAVGVCSLLLKYARCRV